MTNFALKIPMFLARAADELAKSTDFRVLRRVPKAEEITLSPSHRNSLVKLAILDCETTGLDMARDEIIELAITQVVINSDGQVVEIHPCQSWMEEPTAPLEPNITQITGITDSDLAGQSLDDRAINQCLRWADVLVSHNAAFDRAFLARRFPDFATSHRWGCTVNDIDWRSEGFGGRSLFHLLTEIGWFFEGHRAESDCSALVWLLAQKAHDGQPYFWHLLEQVRSPSWRIFAERAPKSVKDRLKSRGYRWNPQRQVWWRDIRLEDEQNERAWLDRLCLIIKPVCEQRTCYDRYS